MNLTTTYLKPIIFILFTLIGSRVFCQPFPTFGTEIKVSITNLNFDAMEPFISHDGNTLFFNSLNSGGNTNLHFATKVNDSTFNYVGLVDGCFDPSPNHLDAVASMDSMNNFYWTSLRNIPNLYRGVYTDGQVSSLSPVWGTCNILTPGWLIMDAAIHVQGNLLYYSNAYFGPTYTECVGVPCEAVLSIAEKINDTTFNKTSYSDDWLANINDTSYLVYAPQLSEDGLELYYTRLLKNGFNTEICVSVRNTVLEPFSLPQVIYSNFGYFPEAPTLSSDKHKLYYHKKNELLMYSIYLRYRTDVSAITNLQNKSQLVVYPNPSQGILHVVLPDPSAHCIVSIYSLMGQEVYKAINQSSIDLSSFSKGIYTIILMQNESSCITKFIKEE